MAPCFRSRRAVSDGGLHLSVAYDLTSFMKVFDGRDNGNTAEGPRPVLGPTARIMGILLRARKPVLGSTADLDLNLEPRLYIDIHMYTLLYVCTRI